MVRFVHTSQPSIALVACLRPSRRQLPIRCGASLDVSRSAQKSPQMSADGDVYRLFNVAVSMPLDTGKDDYSAHQKLCEVVAKKLGIKDKSKLSSDAIRVVRKSFDARKTDQLRWQYVVDVDSIAIRAAGGRKPAEKQGSVELLASLSKDQVSKSTSSLVSSKKSEQPVLVVGSGPAGLFAALELAEAGLPVILLERGQSVEVRGRDIGALMVRRQLNPDSNLCYGLGGAGTYSDGKLTTRIGRNEDPVRRVLTTLYEFGAPESVLVSGKPHLGTDRLMHILRGFRDRLEQLGVDIRFNAKVSRLIATGGRVSGVELIDGSHIAASKVVLAVGHSAREIYRNLLEIGAELTPKPFSMGFRIEHPQAVIDSIQYGSKNAELVKRGKGIIPVAEYRLAANFENSDERRSVYSFCMCPGGQIVPTSTSQEELCINGMSFSRRDSKWANSALVVSVGESDWAHHVAAHGPLAGMEFQREIERKAAKHGGGNFVAPVQRVVDFMAGQPSKGDLPTSSYRLGVIASPLHDFYSSSMTEAFRKALNRFEIQMPGFIHDQALLHAAETRTSAPIQITRDALTTESVTLRDMHPCGEGAGYAGGIISAAVDGMKVGRMVAAELTGRSDLAEGFTGKSVSTSY